MSAKPATRSRSTDRLLVRLREMGIYLPDEAKIVRTRAGRQQRVKGAWSWYVVDVATNREINPPVGSADTVAECLAAEYLHVWGRGYTEVGGR